MKILRIAGHNLASLAAPFCVDFDQEPLGSCGLFAICGPTGSGKSTLLDALCLALYDATPRLLKSSRSAGLLPDVGADTIQADATRTLLRRGAALGYSEVDFIGNDGHRYRARWDIRRAYSKASGRLQDPTMSLLQLPQQTPLGGTKREVLHEIEQRIGLSFEQFTRAVLLAQNEFSAFLRTDENDRGELLETLTGSVIYSTISQRAFERYKTEQASLRALSGRIADHQPLSADARAGLEEQLVASRAAVAGIDVRKNSLEQQQRWHQQDALLCSQQEQAERALAQANEQLEQSGPRRMRLATLDAVQEARPLAREAERLDAQVGEADRHGSACEQQVLAATQQQQQASASLHAAAAALQLAEQAMRDSAPRLDVAKGLDAAIAALQPSWLQAAAAREAAVQARTSAQDGLTALDTTLAQRTAAHHSSTDWLGQHAQLETLALQWPRWESLLNEAGEALELETALTAAHQAAREHTAATAALQQSADIALEQANTQRERDAVARDAASAALTEADGAAIAQAKQALEARRELLTHGERAWQQLEQANSAAAQCASQAAQATHARDAAAADAAVAAAQLPVSGAALEQAQRSLSSAELACAGDVEQLRTQLAPDQPCPVCGGLDHPYQHQNTALHAVLDGLRKEVELARTRHQEVLSQSAASKALVAANEAQLRELATTATQLAATAIQAQREWDASPLAGAAAGDPAQWFAAEQAGMRAQLLECRTREQALHSAQQALGRAQAACDASGKADADAQRAAHAAAQAHSAAVSAQAALQGKGDHASAQLKSALRQLDQALPDDWQLDWRLAPLAYARQCGESARQWQQQSATALALTGELRDLALQRDNALDKAAQCARDAALAEEAFAAIDARLCAMRVERGELWQGRAVREVESELVAAIDTARATVSIQQAAAEQAAHALTRAQQARLLAGEQVAMQRAALASSHAALNDWIGAFAARFPQLDHPLDAAALGALLTHDAGFIQQERDVLAAISDAVASCSTVLQERRTQCERHRAAATEQSDGDAQALAEALAAVEQERAAAHESATALALQLAQDDLRKQQAGALLAQIGEQEIIERRWASLNELIGSADGKKFRNYAQQFTLDVLLGYANSHLAQLARRYRLERVGGATGPSLGLMVRDRDMADEARSVNSLSGGESFLVSLALALGLASLSSNRVRVESLFIDEGFGSLDSETLRVAMDALDSLQSSGRKVGVISHVQEMTERIGTRITVQPCGGGASVVSVQ